ncbi:MAG: hypothetical protein KF905_15545 [Flavobacteriales bacterium]|nr:hypothetical protein [Flavobacteriales bacterium]
MNRLFLASTLGNDPHTEGPHIASKVAKLADIPSVLLKPSPDHALILEGIHTHDPLFLGFSYRLTPAIGVAEFKKVLFALRNEGLLVGRNGEPRQIAFSGLPDTIAKLRAIIHELPCPVQLMEPHPNVMDRIDGMLDFFAVVKDRDRIRTTLRNEIEPPGIAMLDQLADEVVRGKDYLNEPPLPVPSPAAIKDYTVRIQESGLPVIRSHFGIPHSTIEPTVEGIREIAEARVIDEVSLGSSDLSQRYFGKPEEFEKRKDDGGVPYRTEADLVRLFQASRTGNHPSLKPYAHVVDLVPFIDTCIRTGMLVGAHQAIPLFWFNQLDGRGPTPVPESIAEHIAAVRELARRGIPVEMNDPNQWSSRWAHDTIIVSSYALISAVMSTNGVKDMVLQMQFNKPRETSDHGDLAKMTAGLEIAATIASHTKPAPNIYRETRTGIESLSPDLDKARWQLGRSTLLQMMVDPHILHLVSFCEANYAARPADIIESSKLIRRAVRIFREHAPDLLKNLEDPIVLERREHLLKEASYLLREIAKLNEDYGDQPLPALAPLLADARTLAASMEHRLMSAPGIVLPDYANPSLVTRPRNGFIDAVDNVTGTRVLTEAERTSAAGS